MTSLNDLTESSHLTSYASTRMLKYTHTLQQISNFVRWACNIIKPSGNGHTGTIRHGRRDLSTHPRTPEV